MRTYPICEEHVPQLVGMMRSCEVFAPLTDDQMRKVVPLLVVQEFEAGEVVFHKGDPGDAFYVIYAGQVEVQTEGFLGSTKVLRTMGPGEFLGELALILNQPRSATIFCTYETQFFVLSRLAFDIMLTQNPDIAAIVKTAGRERFENRP